MHRSPDFRWDIFNVWEFFPELWHNLTWFFKNKFVLFRTSIRPDDLAAGCLGRNSGSCTRFFFSCVLMMFILISLILITMKRYQNLIHVVANIKSCSSVEDNDSLSFAKFSWGPCSLFFALTTFHDVFRISLIQLTIVSDVTYANLMSIKPIHMWNLSISFLIHMLDVAISNMTIAAKQFPCR